MNGFLLIIMAATSTTATEPSESAFLVEVEVPVGAGEIRPGMRLHFVPPLFLLDRTLGVFGRAKQEDVVGSVIAGLRYAPIEWASIELGGGLELAGVPYRVGMYIRLGEEQNAIADMRFEIGGSGYWWDLGFNAKFLPWAGLGIVYRRLDGVGPRVKLELPWIPVRGFWTLFIGDPETHKLVLHSVAGFELAFGAE